MTEEEKIQQFERVKYLLTQDRLIRSIERELKYTTKSPSKSHPCYHICIRTRESVNKVLANIAEKS